MKPMIGHVQAVQGDDQEAEEYYPFLVAADGLLVDQLAHVECVVHGYHLLLFL